MSKEDSTTYINLSVLNDQKKVVLVGNPNVGKTVIFNELTGNNQRIANFPGVTISYKSGKMKSQNEEFEIVDLPGIYGFSANRLDEKVALEYVLTNNQDLIVNVIDGTKFNRNMFLTLQLKHLKSNMILVINYKDKLDRSSIKIDDERLEEILGIPVIQISALNSADINQLRQLIIGETNPFDNVTYKENPRVNPIIKAIKSEAVGLFHSLDYSYRNNADETILYTALFASGSQYDIYPFDLAKEIKTLFIEKMKEQNPGYVKDDNVILEIISDQYEDIRTISELVMFKSKTPKMDEEKKSISDWADKVFLHPVLGLFTFTLLMFGLFQLTYSVSEPISNWIDLGFGALSEFVFALIPNDFIASFFADGLIAGLGFVLVFIPQIAFLFLGLSLLEHSGYLTRVVFLLDKYLSKLGISGSSVAPMLLGFGCNVPAILSTKTITNDMERKAVMFANPYFSCSARLPVYVIFGTAIFGNRAPFVITAIYFLGIAIAIATIFLLRQTVLTGKKNELIMEMTDLATPNTRTLFLSAFTHTKHFIQSAGTWMAGGLILIWLLSVMGPSGYLGSEALSDPELLKSSLLFIIGDFLSPVFAPLGWDNRLIVALIFGFIAKEIVIGSMGILYGAGNDLGSLEASIAAIFTPVSGFAFMAFVLVYTPCIGAVFALKREGGTKLSIISVVFSLLLAYTLALSITLIGNAIFN